MKRPHKSRATTTSSTAKGRILRLAAETVRMLGLRYHLVDHGETDTTHRRVI